MVSRWIAITFALVPVLFVPACYGTRAVLIARERVAVHGIPAGAHPSSLDLARAAGRR
jgi:hypothetical protein